MKENEMNPYQLLWLQYMDGGVDAYDSVINGFTKAKDKLGVEKISIDSILRIVEKGKAHFIETVQKKIDDGANIPEE